VLTWTIPILVNETATLSYTITHNQPTGGVKQVNDSVTFVDDNDPDPGAPPTWPVPMITVNCDEPPTNIGIPLSAQILMGLVAVIGVVALGIRLRSRVATIQ
jgi:hypothetical protein